MEEVVKLIMSWRHSSFSFHCGPGIRPGDEEVMENLARQMIQDSFSQMGVTYIQDKPKVGRISHQRPRKSEA